LHGLRALAIAELVLRDMAQRDPVTHGLLIRTTEGNPRRNPLVKIAADSAGDMIRFAGEFGMTPVARSRIAAGVGPQPPDKFGDLLA
jgi:P27 family predicted phage terminase small subunit